jgi:tetratricopeptide (TPR) repeat protein
MRMKGLVAAAALAAAIVLPMGAGAQSNAEPHYPDSPSNPSHVGMPSDSAPHAYGRGARELRKAKDAKDPADRLKHYSAAQAAFRRSISLQSNYDALLGLGEADLALGDTEEAIYSCERALDLKRKSEPAKACIDQAFAIRAKLKAQKAAAAPPGTGPQ